MEADAENFLAIGHPTGGGTGFGTTTRRNEAFLVGVEAFGADRDDGISIGVFGKSLRDDGSEYLQQGGRGIGVKGVAGEEGTGIRGEGGWAGIEGTSPLYGVHATGGQCGVAADAGPAAGAIGVRGSSVSGPGVKGISYDGEDLHDPGATNGVEGSSGSGDGVNGASVTGAGVSGTSTEGRGGDFAGGAAAIRLRPSTGSGPPPSGEAGDLAVDGAGTLWFCKGDGDWHQVLLG